MSKDIVIEDMGHATITGSLAISGDRAPFFRRLWFLVSAIPRYLISGSVEVP